MKKLTKRLSPSEAVGLGLPVKPVESYDLAHNSGNPRYTITPEEWATVVNMRGVDRTGVEVSSDTITSSNEYSKKPKHTSESDPDARQVLMSSWDYESGQNLDIEAYCTKFNLPYKHLTSYKAVTHTGKPFYNTVFKEIKLIIGEDLTEEYLEELVKSHIEYIPIAQVVPTTINETFHEDNWDRATYTDVHVGMDPNSKGKALYPVDWSDSAIYARALTMARKIIEKQTGPILYIEDLGDLMDGLNGETVRKGHKLPQLMTNQEAFTCGVNFKVWVIDALVAHYEYIASYNVTDDNHSGDFGWMVNEAAKRILEVKYGKKVYIKNMRKFMDYYLHDHKVFVLCHGKDGEALKFGFTPHIKPAHIEKIDQFLKYEELYSKGEIQFCKGDSHQCLFDAAASDDFDYNNYPAFSPSSEWVQTNFKKGRSGFVLEHHTVGIDDFTRQVVWFDKKGLKKK